MRWHDEQIKSRLHALLNNIGSGFSYETVVPIVREMRDDYEAALLAQRAEAVALAMQPDRFPISRGELESLRFRLNEANELLAPLVQENDSLKDRISELEAQLSAARATIERACGQSESDGRAYAEGCAP